MTDLQLVIIVQFILIATLFIFILRLKKRLDIYDEWADQVDEFMDSQYIELDFMVEEKEGKK